VKKTGNSDVEVMKLDFNSLNSVREFVKEFLRKEKRLDVLINNAAASGMANRLTEDGLQQQMQINHYGPFLLTNLLLGNKIPKLLVCLLREDLIFADVLKKSAPSRIVMVSSVMHKYGAIDLENLNCEKSFPGSMKLYSNAKLANILLANELAIRLDGTGKIIH
jgi:NAD(P)-dependent dehydrogenase (short-subunit alcohol dehydrogenase family)